MSTFDMNSKEEVELYSRRLACMGYPFKRWAIEDKDYVFTDKELELAKEDWDFAGSCSIETATNQMVGNSKVKIIVKGKDIMDHKCYMIRDVIYKKYDNYVAKFKEEDSEYNRHLLRNAAFAKRLYDIIHFEHGLLPFILNHPTIIEEDKDKATHRFCTTGSVLYAKISLYKTIDGNFLALGIDSQLRGE